MAKFTRLHGSPWRIWKVLRQVRLVDHQRLTGNVQWWAVCAPSLKALLGSLYAMSASVDSIWLAPSGTAEEVAMMWEEYDDAKAKVLLRTLVEYGGQHEECFQARIVDSRTRSASTTSPTCRAGST